MTTYNETGTGNLLASGSATVTAVYLVNGNCLASGTAPNNAVFNVKGSTLYLAGPQQTEVNLLSGLVSGKAKATVDTVADYAEAASAVVEDGTGSDWVNKFNILELAIISGHKSLKMLQRYTHIKAEDLVDKIN